MAEIKFDEKLLRAKIDKIVEFQKKFVGKPNMNPFIWIDKHVTPLVQRLDKKEATQALADAINALKEVEPIVNPDLPKEAPPVKEPILVPAGLKLKEKS